jgi:hypothetical protein
MSCGMHEILVEPIMVLFLGQVVASVHLRVMMDLSGIQVQVPVKV